MAIGSLCAFQLQLRRRCQMAPHTCREFAFRVPGWRMPHLVVGLDTPIPNLLLSFTKQGLSYVTRCVIQAPTSHNFIRARRIWVENSSWESQGWLGRAAACRELTENKTLTLLVAENGLFSKTEQVGNWSYRPNQKNLHVTQNKRFTFKFPFFSFSDFFKQKSI